MVLGFRCSPDRGGKVAQAARLLSAYAGGMTPEAPFQRRVAAVRRIWSPIRMAAVALLLALGGPAIVAAQARPVPGAASDTGALETALSDTAMLTQAGSRDTVRQGSPDLGPSHSQRKVTRQLGELEPVLEWQWGAILATVLAMTG